MKILKQCAYINTFHIRITCTLKRSFLNLIQLFQVMRFVCVSNAYQKCLNALRRRWNRFKCVSCSMSGTNKQIVRLTVSQSIVFIHYQEPRNPTTGERVLTNLTSLETCWFTQVALEMHWFAICVDSRKMSRLRMWGSLQKR